MAAEVEEVEEPKGLQRRRVAPLRAMLGVWLLVMGAGGSAVAGVSGTRGMVKLVGANVPVNQGARDLRDISAHNSPTLVRNPVDGANLVIANRIDTPLFSCAMHVSTDGGASWNQTPIPAPAGEEPKCFAPDVAFAADGTLHLFFVTLKGLGNTPNAGWLVNSRDGGKTLSTPVRVEVVGPLAFQVRLVTDPTVSGRLYLSWLQAADTGTLKFPEPGYPINVARSDDGGVTFGPPVRVSPVERQRVVAPTLAIGPDGGLYLAYLDLGDDKLDYEGGHEGRGGDPYAGFWQLVVARSEDGKDWNETTVESRLVPTERFVVFLPPYPSLAVGSKGRVYVSFHDGHGGDPDVWLWRSTDAGESFSGRTRVNDTAEPDRTSQYLPKIALAPDGRVDVMYFDRRGDKKDQMNEVSLQSSFDGGRHFTDRLRLSSQPFSSRVGFGSERGLPDLGSRLGLVSTESRALGVWTDTRAGTEASNKQDLARGVAEVIEPKGLSPASERNVRAAGAASATAGLTVLGSWFVTRRRSRSEAA